jgi:hypothetical protein
VRTLAQSREAYRSPEAMLFQAWMRGLAMAWLRKVAMARGCAAGADAGGVFAEADVTDLLPG